MMRISVQYTTMIVKSLEESVSFYRDIMGFREGYHVDFPVGGITIMESPQGACVELIEAPQFEVGLYSVGTDVENLDETIAHLQKHGYEPLGEIAKTTVGRQIFVMDPNGVRICLIEHTEEYRQKYMQENKIIDN
jgi:lactoylglutathione lyase